MGEEVWKDVVGFEGLYQVSNLGRLKGLPRRVNNHKGFIQLGERYLSGHQITKGYIQVQLSSRPNRVQKLIHVLVATAFIPNPNNYPQVNHINGDKADNRAENLEWVTQSENIKHAYRTGLNIHSDKSGKPKRPIILIHSKNGERIRFDSLANAAKFLGEGHHNRVNLQKVLSPKYTHYKTVKGFYATYEN